MNLTQHFRLEEFNKHNFPITNYHICNFRHIAVFLEQVRASFGHPIIITSGYRTKEFNATLDGAVPNSYHLYAKAVDLTCDPRWDLRDLYFALAKNVPDGLKYEYKSEGLFDEFFNSLDPSDKTYIEFHSKRRYIHIQFGTRDTSPLNLIQYFPFQRKITPDYVSPTDKDCKS